MDTDLFERHLLKKIRSCTLLIEEAQIQKDGASNKIKKELDKKINLLKIKRITFHEVMMDIRKMGL